MPNVNLNDLHLTPTQTAFVAAFCANGGQQAKAYNQASSTASIKTAQVQSTRLMRLPKIAQAIARYKHGIAQKTEVSEALLVSEYWSTYQAARTGTGTGAPDLTAARMCLDSLAKLTGLMVDRRETKTTSTVEHRLSAVPDAQLFALLDAIDARQTTLAISAPDAALEGTAVTMGDTPSERGNT